MLSLLLALASAVGAQTPALPLNEFPAELRPAAPTLPPYRIYQNEPLPPAAPGPGARLPVVWLVPRLGSNAGAAKAKAAAEKRVFDEIFSSCGISLEVRAVAVFDLAVPLTHGVSDRVLDVGPINLAGFTLLTGREDPATPEFMDSFAATLAALAAEVAPTGLAIFDLASLLKSPGVRLGYADYEEDESDDYLVLGSPKGQPPELGRKTFSHEVGHLAFRESHPDGDANLMSTGVGSTSTAVTLLQCAKAWSYVSRRWP